LQINGFRHDFGLEPLKTPQLPLEPVVVKNRPGGQKPEKRLPQAKFGPPGASLGVNLDPKTVITRFFSISYVIFRPFFPLFWHNRKKKKNEYNLL